ncbi:MAG: hypothetical protein IH600_18510, partial [Bacteroidetes bacterium]|nr:hypothetical protein [Bacteroidota bacterium]
MKRSLLWFAFVAILTMPLAAQDTDEGGPVLRARYGIFGDYSLNYHTADFRQLPGVPNCCPRFETGDGTGFALGVLYELPLQQKLALLLRLGYADYSGLLTAQEKEMLYVAPSYYEGTFEHTVDATLAAIVLEPMLAWKLVDRLSLLAGLQAGYVMTADYAQLETIVDPADRGVFVDTQQRTRNASAGNIPDASSFTASLMGGLRYEVPLDDDGTLTAAPEALFSYGLTPVVSDLDWQVNTLRFGVSLLYRPSEEKAAPPPP